MSFNNFMLYIRLIKINPETDRAYQVPCEITPQFCINLEEYLTSFTRTEERNNQAYENAICEVLGGLYKVYGTPLGWLIQMEHYETPFLNPPPYDKPELTETKLSKNFVFDPSRNQTDIDVEFMYQWAITELNKANSFVN
ncbi:MAG: hypothetical protein KG003_13775 [Bacteroidetes bacterium]|nr:hypothetical protein [Bacteroidota bacterium]